MRICRVCLLVEEDEIYQPILKEGYKTALSLFYLSGIIIVELAGLPQALICSKCVVAVNNAAQLKRISLVADQYFRKQSQEIEESLFTDDSSPAFLCEEKSDCNEKVDTVDDVFELIEYDDTVEEFIEEEWIEVQNENQTQSEKQHKNPNKARKQGAERQIRQCHCGITFSSNQRLRNHIRVRHEFVPDSELLPCELCDKKFKLQEYLEVHMRNQHGDGPLRQRQKMSCSICGRVLSSILALKNHEEKHQLDQQPSDKSKKVVCDLCGQGFRMKSYLFNHLHNVHIRRKYPCTFCSRGFYKKYEMMDHVRQYHTMETPFQCEFEGCVKSFSRKKNYLIHRRVHTGERPYQCKLCERSFMHCTDRKRHMMKHTGERPYNCKCCSKGFMRRTELDTHMRSHIPDSSTVA